VGARVVRGAQYSTLATYGLTQADWPTVIEKSTVASSMKSNPIQLSADEMGTSSRKHCSFPRHFTTSSTGTHTPCDHSAHHRLGTKERVEHRLFDALDDSRKEPAHRLLLVG